MENKPCIALIQPSSSPNKESFEKAIDLLREYSIPFKNFVDFSEDAPFHKALLLYELITSQKFTHLWAVRGGSGAIKLLPYLEELFSAKPHFPSAFPQLIGYSDITTLHLYFWKKFRIKGLHAPMVLDILELETKALQELWNFLFKNNRKGELNGKAFRNGYGEGILLGGNLSLFASLCGTPYFPKCKNIILILEDINEKNYRLERSLLQIIYSLPKNSIKGLLLGDLGEVSPLDFLRKIEEFLPAEIPIGYAFPIGHIPKNLPFIYGAKAKLKIYAEKAELSFKY